jgi:hypothetical protein
MENIWNIENVNFAVLAAVIVFCYFARVSGKEKRENLNYIQRIRDDFVERDMSEQRQTIELLIWLVEKTERNATYTRGVMGATTAILVFLIFSTYID